jgi:hypothetical protein
VVPELQFILTSMNKATVRPIDRECLNVSSFMPITPPPCRTVHLTSIFQQLSLSLKSLHINYTVSWPLPEVYLIHCGVFIPAYVSDVEHKDMRGLNASGKLICIKNSLGSTAYTPPHFFENECRGYDHVVRTVICCHQIWTRLEVDKDCSYPNFN